MNQVRELDWVSNKKYRSIVSNHVVVSFFGVVLESETTRITITIVGSTFSSNSGETQEDGSLLSNLIHELGFAQTKKLRLEDGRKNNKN